MAAHANITQIVFLIFFITLSVDWVLKRVVRRLIVVCLLFGRLLQFTTWTEALSRLTGVEGVNSTEDGRGMRKYLGSGWVRVQGQLEVLQKQLPN